MIIRHNDIWKLDNANPRIPIELYKELETALKKVDEVREKIRRYLDYFYE